MFVAAESAPKGFMDGTHRLVSPERTIERVLPLAPVMGITRVANVTGLDAVGVPVVMVCRPNSRSLAVSQGKGLTLAAAKASGLMEAIELYHAERITLPIKFASYDELQFTHPLVDVEALPRLSASAFTEHTRLMWIEARDLLNEEPVWVPYDMVHMNYTRPFPPGTCFVPSSNGLASGNHILEAITHGISEVIERDAATLWHASGKEIQRETRIDLATVDDPGCLEVLQRFERANIVAGVWDVTSNIGVPSFLCSILDRTPDPYRPVVAAEGKGCHPARHVALLRALTEAAQSRLTWISGARDDMPRSEYELSRNPDVLERQRSELRNGATPRSFRDVPSQESATFERDVAWLLERLRAAGIKCVAVVDLTHPGLRVPVVRVVIPGLEALHDAPGYLPGARARAVRLAVQPNAS